MRVHDCTREYVCLCLLCVVCVHLLIDTRKYTCLYIYPNVNVFVHILVCTYMESVLDCVCSQSIKTGFCTPPSDKWSFDVYTLQSQALSGFSSMYIYIHMNIHICIHICIYT